jgi:DNA invertase Pin-like site-specific DNA recombinase
MIFSILSYVAERERQDIKARQKEGIEVAKRNGTKFGRPTIERPSNFDEVYNRVKKHEITNRKAMELLNLKPNTYYRFANEIQ